ncbi:MAG: hypothetical protein FJ029_05160 [Actinobacteria bacterium]|nr:hypothetical protein [Actinomycetota bacterium]
MTGLWGRVRSSVFSWLTIAVFFLVLDFIDGLPISWSFAVIAAFACWPGFFVARWYIRGY